MNQKPKNNPTEEQKNKNYLEKNISEDHESAMSKNNEDDKTANSIDVTKGSRDEHESDSLIDNLKKEHFNVKENKDEVKEDKVKEDEVKEDEVKEVRDEIKVDHDNLKEDHDDLKMEHMESYENFVDFKEKPVEVNEEPVEAKEGHDEFKEKLVELKEDSAKVELREDSVEVKEDSAEVKEDSAEVKKESLEVKEKPGEFKQEPVEIKEKNDELEENNSEPTEYYEQVVKNSEEYKEDHHYEVIEKHDERENKDVEVKVDLVEEKQNDTNKKLNKPNEDHDELKDNNRESKNKEDHDKPKKNQKATKIDSEEKIMSNKDQIKFNTPETAKSRNVEEKKKTNSQNKESEKLKNKHLYNEILNGEDDEKYLSSLSDAQREKIIYERFLRIKRFEERRELERRLENHEKVDNTIKKRKAENRYSESSGDDNSSDGQVIKKLKSRIDDDSSDILKSGEVKISKNVLNFEDFKKIIFKRDEITPFVYRSDLDVLIGNYVMMRIDEDCVACKITSIFEGPSVYTVDLGERRNKTNLLLNLKNGDKSYENVKLIYLSNSEISLSVYQNLLKKNLIPSIKQKQKYKDAKDQMNKKLTDLEITKTIEKRKKFYPQKVCRAKQKIELIQRKNKLMTKKKFKEAQEIQKLIDQMNEEDKEEKDIWVKLSERNSKMNKENGIRAQSVKRELVDPKADALNPFKRKKHRFIN
ncbi:hypothetical protein DMUE_0831 [Dictyocoela muelleri]|nr:hypothetical protein DMUE_0831 [Dictyocoela muelleri]